MVNFKTNSNNEHQKYKGLLPAVCCFNAAFSGNKGADK
ncbi:hypothetical protein FLA_2783 [Filimonas lacunae]|nr:hypothetical protein FLA_2783 [Filimonas lacunae]